MICPCLWIGLPTEAVNRLADKLKAVLTEEEVQALIQALQEESDSVRTISPTNAEERFRSNEKGQYKGCAVTKEKK